MTHLNLYINVYARTLNSSEVVVSTRWFNSVAVCDKDCLPNAACFCCLAILLRMNAAARESDRQFDRVPLEHDSFLECILEKPRLEWSAFWWLLVHIGLSALGQKTAAQARFAMTM